MAEYTVQMNMLNSNGTYDELYPYIKYNMNTTEILGTINNAYYDLQFYNGSDYITNTDFSFDVIDVVSTYGVFTFHRIRLLLYDGTIIGNRKYKLQLKEQFYFNNNEKIIIANTTGTKTTNDGTLLYSNVSLPGNLTNLNAYELYFSASKNYTVNSFYFMFFITTVKYY